MWIRKWEWYGTENVGGRFEIDERAGKLYVAFTGERIGRHKANL